MHSRFTPVDGRILLKPGDWVRTDRRGANAVALRLVKQTDVTLGPGSLVEVVRPNLIRVSSGTLKITAEPKAPLEVVGPGGQTVKVEGTRLYRIDGEEVVDLTGQQVPLWLAGFEGTTNNESVGSLIANVDGQNKPLTIGHHKVTVTIRDQIALTEIDESFVNHTDSRTEGIFYSPLPQDASISGFAMWIDDKMVEADVVEKQRAREIYETILREKRDPGLLEWTGGNIFKARVFPIFAHSRKRIKITYTQVLPLRGNSYRYSYALQSEMLKENPLEELAIDVRVYSAMPLAEVTSPTHMARIDRTEHSAHVEFTAQEYTPDRDFEVVVEVDGRQSDLVMIPHQRGKDGYFMLQLTPPAADGQWQRDVLPDGQPMEVLILADTSASLSRSDRTTQSTFVASLLQSLTPEDRINLAVCDVDCRWVFEEPVPADETNVELARRFLDDRVSLGWTDLDKAFASALEQSGPKTHVIYVGDGIVTVGDGDPVAFGKRLKRLYQDRAGTFHAVTVGSSFEAVVLRTIASLGGGSFRQISGQQGPETIARELLGEIARPGIRDLKVAFPGLEMVKVYPEVLPNIPAGSQQILLGRYLPTGEDQAGEVVVTGTQDGRPVRFRQPVVLEDGVQSNSFIPRLWARRHLDALLQEGTSQPIQDEIIALSEEYNIITPYTSLLVLESDEDRERFGVKRRFQMTDAEKFFAEGRENANFELRQQQMRLAGNWRLGLRRNVLAELMGLGRDAQMLSQMLPQWEGIPALRTNFVLGMELVSTDGTVLTTAGERSGRLWDVNGPMRFSWGEDQTFDGRVDEILVAHEDEPGGEIEGDFKKVVDAEGFPEFEGEPGMAPPGQSMNRIVASPRPVLGNWQASYDFDGAGSVGFRLGLEYNGRSRAPNRGLFAVAGGTLNFERYGQSGYYPQNYTQWVNTLFPHLPAPPKETVEQPQPAWPAEAKALAESLLRNGQLAALDGGLQVQRRWESFDARWNNLTSRSQSLALASPTAWLILDGGNGSNETVSWCDGRERGVFSKTFQLGRLRDSQSEDLGNPPLGLEGYALRSIERTYPRHSVELKPQGNARLLLILTDPDVPHRQDHVLIDTARHVVLSIESRYQGNVTSSTRFEDFVEVADCWWAGRIEHLDAQGRRTVLITQEFKLLTADAFDQQWKKELAGRDRVQFLHEPPVSTADAKQADADGKATFDDQFALLLHFAGNQQWDRVMERLDKAEQSAAGKPGMRWVRDAVLNVSRRREELRERILGEAGALAKPQAADYFLAEHLRGQASGIFEANEMLALLDVLKPVYERQAAHLNAMKQWTQQRVNYLQQTGQSDRALGLQRQLAEEYPHDYSAQQQYAQALANARDYAAAYAWLDGVISDEAKWFPYEEESLRNLYAQYLRQQGRYPDLADYLAAWIDRDPPSSSPYSQYLTALIRTDRVEEADGLISRWLEESRASGPLKAEVGARLDAAAGAALGRGYNLYTDRIEERWLEPLAAAAIFFARHESRAVVAERIMQDDRFHQTDQCRRVRKWAAETLTTQIEELTPDEIQRLVNWIAPNDPAVEAPTWKLIADGLRQRWLAEKDAEGRNRLAQPLLYVLRSHRNAEELLEFLRLQVEKHRCRNSYTQLFDALLGQPWSAAIQAEAFAILEKQSYAAPSEDQLRIQVEALYRLTDRMVQARYEGLMGAVEHQEELSRSELRDLQSKNLRTAREDFSECLQEEMPKQPEALRPWLEVERLYLDVRLGRNLDEVQEACWEFVGPKPPVIDANADSQQRLEEVLRHRYLVMLANLAARKDADPQLADRLLGYLDRGIEADAQDVRWKLFKYQLLIALDRPDALVESLEEWIRPEDADNFWRLSLGRIYAERGQIDKAIELFEIVEAADELGPAEYRTLADWYMVVDDRAAYERARIAAYQFTEEWQLSNWLSAKLSPWQRDDGKVPDDFDEEVLLVFAALFEKSGYPQNYLGYLQQFYQATHEFRLLAGLPDAVVGHTAAKVYPFLGGMGSVLSEVRKEATADAIVARLVEVRGRAKTDVDHRALDLLELLVERRSAEVINQPGPHVEKALAAMQRAFKRAWSPGEPRLMADFLAGLGAITQQELADEQLRQLEALHRQATPGSVDRLHIAYRLAETRWGYSRHDAAIDLLDAALIEYEDANDGVLPVDANGPLDSLIQYLESQKHFARGEKALLDQLQHPVHKQQTYWLTERLYRLYRDALQSDGDVSLGTGEVLYRALERKLRDELATADHDHRYALIDRLCDVYHVARDKKFPSMTADLRAFAFTHLPGVLEQQTSNYQSIVGRVAHTLHDLAGARDGLEFLIERIEQEPSWFRLVNDDGWRHHASNLGYWRTEVKQLDDLEDRLLKIVVAELRRDLDSGQGRNRSIYWQSNWYWTEKEDVFAQTAEEVYARRKQSGAAVEHIADYLWHGLHHFDRAIEIMMTAHKQKVLGEQGQRTLISYLHSRDRYAESIPILRPLVALRPDSMDYRVLLMEAYFHSDKPEELVALWQQTDEHFHQGGRWTEGNMAALAWGCLDTRLYEQSAAYYQEVVSLHKRTHPGRGVGDGTLSTYCREMARAYAGLKDTVGAVDAACEAIVCWGPQHDERREALNTLRQVLRDSPDLDAYVAELDRQCEEAKQEKPIVRKALGEVYFDGNQFDKAIAQLKLACEVEPDDQQTHDKLIECYDKQQDEEGAVQQLLDSLQLLRRDIGRYKNLGTRLEKLDRLQDAERAYTSIVEMLPSESESHTMLAEIRQGQDRWDEAIVHWRQVARIRALEPTGLLNLAGAQIYQEQWDQALETVGELDGQSWPPRFGDVHEKVRQLERQIEDAREK
ncbi:MAG TPA: VIT domain-containing protein [Thermoguttaceae bacterium]|nr:VIT domain-containing protein [Thermoguttaceae bacterium]